MYWMKKMLERNSFGIHSKLFSAAKHISLKKGCSILYKPSKASGSASELSSREAGFFVFFLAPSLLNRPLRWRFFSRFSWFRDSFLCSFSVKLYRSENTFKIQ